jgi:hypothetical protein
MEERKKKMDFWEATNFPKLWEKFCVSMCLGSLGRGLPSVYDILQGPWIIKNHGIEAQLIYSGLQWVYRERSKKTKAMESLLF